jgi:hypothetical protein
MTVTRTSFLKRQRQDIEATWVKDEYVDRRSLRSTQIAASAEAAHRLRRSTTFHRGPFSPSATGLKVMNSLHVSRATGAQDMMNN